ncbi:Transposase, Ptta/En/Spm, plant [Corchorus olitorius]|uniref:Transposase, Ptta/En/Spm, plant n=1 Tax=Corchorus olitorius TaxID=93759 RepID=A0A1R3I9M9_9ROSI|nr:Transposase, Ptta/En/Spm, plant [Corchorus olitorius]
MRKGRQVIGGPPWDNMPSKAMKVTAEDALFFVSKSGRLLQFTNSDKATEDQIHDAKQEVCINNDFTASLDNNMENSNDPNRNCDTKVAPTRPIPFSEDSVIFELRDGRLLLVAERLKLEQYSVPMKDSYNKDQAKMKDKPKGSESAFERSRSKVMKGVGKEKSQKAKCGKKMQPQLKPPPGFVCEKSLSTQRTPLTRFPRDSSTTAQGNPARGLLAARKAIPTQTESSKGCPAGEKRKSFPLRENSELVQEYDSDSTQSPDESDDEYGSEDDHDMTTPSDLPDHREKNGRGQYMGKRLDLKTQAGTVKLTVRLASDRLRPVGPNARDLANYCGYTVRTFAPIDAKNWEEAYRSSGEEMLNAIKELFECPTDERRFDECCKLTMGRLYTGWRNRLHMIYKSFASAEEASENPPDGLTQHQWVSLIESVFEDAEFKKVSERNSSNAKKRKQVHTTGNKSFAEFEDDLLDPETGLLPRADKIWFLEHSRKNKDEEVVWSDNYSKEIGEKMTSLIDDPSQEVPRTRDEIHIGAMGGRSGYCRGFGYGKQGLIKGTRASRSLLEQRNQKIEELQEEMANMKAEQEERNQGRKRSLRRSRRGMQNNLKKCKPNF